MLHIHSPDMTLPGNGSDEERQLFALSFQRFRFETSFPT